MAHDDVAHLLGRWCTVTTPSRNFPRDFQIVAVGNLTLRLRNDVEEYSVSMTGFLAERDKSFTVTNERTR
jgi:hypothetical protein